MKRGLIVLVSLLVISLVAIGCAPREPVVPEEYPTSRIEVVCHAAPGGGSDTLARWTARTGEEYFGQDMRVVSKTGGEGATAMSYIRGQPADGHTFGTFTQSTLLAFASGELPYTVKDIASIIRVQADTWFIVVEPGRWDTLDEMLAYARENPGELTAGGYGSDMFTFVRLLRFAGEPDIRWVEFDGSRPALTALLGGHIDIGSIPVSTALEYVETGMVDALGVTTFERMELAPDVPTLIEQGYNLEASKWRGFYAHPDVPMDIQVRMMELIREAIQDEAFVEYTRDAGLIPADDFDSPGEFAAWLENEVVEHEQLLRELGLI